MLRRSTVGAFCFFFEKHRQKKQSLNTLLSRIRKKGNPKSGGIQPRQEDKGKKGSPIRKHRMRKGRQQSCMLSASRNLFKCHEEVLYLQPLIPPKPFDIFSPITGGCSEGLGAL